MLTFPRVICRAAVIAGVAVMGDIAISFGLTLVGKSFVETVGDLMLIEAAILFLLGGLVEFSSSIGGMNIRKLVLGKRENSQSSNREAGRRALVLVLAAAFIFIILLVAAFFLVIWP